MSHVTFFFQFQVFIFNGATACMESLAYACCDPGDVLVTPTPVYGRVFTNFNQRVGVEVVPFDLLPKVSCFSNSYATNKSINYPQYLFNFITAAPNPFNHM